LLLQGCAAPEPNQDLLALTEAQMKIRSVQTRTFDVKDRQLAMCGVIAALQDLGFIIERANEPLDLVAAARSAEPNFYDVIGVTVTVRKRNETQLVVRVSAQYYLRAVEDPAPYQKFFRTLKQTLFLQAGQ
jgi:hypothetical protein